MNYVNIISEKHDEISQIPKVKIKDFLIRDRCNEEQFKQISIAIKQKIPDDLIEFYGQVNGFKFSWSYKDKNFLLSGFCNVVDIETAIFGFRNKGKLVVENRFEDVFWNESFPPHIVKELKQHYLLESFDGESENTTFTIEGKDAQLYDIYEDRISKYKISVKDYLRGIIAWGGLFTVREEFLKNKAVPTKPFNEESNLFFKLTGINNIN